jgi:hypothetical protein
VRFFDRARPRTSGVARGSSRLCAKPGVLGLPLQARWKQELPTARSGCDVGWDVAALRTSARSDRYYHATDESDGLQFTGETIATTHTA